jgi:hypothetical protein
MRQRRQSAAWRAGRNGGGLDAPPQLHPAASGLRFSAARSALRSIHVSSPTHQACGCSSLKFVVKTSRTCGFFHQVAHLCLNVSGPLAAGGWDRFARALNSTLPAIAARSQERAFK